MLVLQESPGSAAMKEDFVSANYCGYLTKEEFRRAVLGSMCTVELCLSAALIITPALSHILHACTCKQSWVEQAWVCRSWHTHTHAHTKAHANSVWELQINSCDLLHFSISANTKVPDCSKLTHIPPVSSALCFTNCGRERCLVHRGTVQASSEQGPWQIARDNGINNRDLLLPFSGSEWVGDVSHCCLLSSLSRLSLRSSGKT